MDGHRGLAVLVGRELLRELHRDRRVARNHLLDDAAHGLEAERQGRNIEQQRITAAGQRFRLERCAQRHDFIRIDVRQRRFADHPGHLGPHQRQAGRASHQHHALHVGRRHAGVRQHVGRNVECA